MTFRLARLEDVETLTALMNAAIAELQKPFLDHNQIASSRLIMGLDTQPRYSIRRVIRRASVRCTLIRTTPVEALAA